MLYSIYSIYSTLGVFLYSFFSFSKRLLGSRSTLTVPVRVSDMSSLGPEVIGEKYCTIQHSTAHYIQ